VNTIMVRNYKKFINASKSQTCGHMYDESWHVNRLYKTSQIRIQTFMCAGKIKMANILTFEGPCHLSIQGNKVLLNSISLGLHTWKYYGAFASY